MAFMEISATTQCAFLEVGTRHSEDEVDESRYQDGISMNMNTNCVCGHTCRVLGPDYRPASEASCRPGRSCFKARGHF